MRNGPRGMWAVVVSLAVLGCAVCTARAQDEEPELLEEPPTAQAPELNTEPTSFWTGWKRSVDLGLDGSDGNSETLNIRGAIGTERKTELMHTTASLSYNFATDDGDTSKNRGEANARNDWSFKDSRWGIFVLGKIEYDEFQDWDWRFSGFGGPSYKFIATERTTLMGRLGIGGAYELGGDTNEFIPELDIGADLTHQIDDRQKLFVTLDYYPSLSDFPAYRWEAKAGYEFIVDPKTNMNLKIGIDDRYDSTPGEGKKRNDIDFFVTLGWVF